MGAIMGQFIKNSLSEIKNFNLDGQGSRSLVLNGVASSCLLAGGRPAPLVRGGG